MPTIILADSHTHLDMPEYSTDQETVIQAAWEGGVRLLINIGISLGNSRQALATAQKYDWIYAAAGVHPHGAASITEDTLRDLARLATHPKVVAVGEIGLDFYRDRAPRDVQEYWCARMLELAVAVGKPVIIHSRDASEASLRLLQEYAPRLAGGVMHCFSGTYEEARACLDLGFMVSFSGVLTYPNAGSLRDVAQKLPLEAVLVETDAPYLSPQARRGKRNEPAYVRYTAETLAQVTSRPLAVVARQTWDNTRRLFRLDNLPPEPAPEVQP